VSARKRFLGHHHYVSRDVVTGYGSGITRRAFGARATWIEVPTYARMSVDFDSTKEASIIILHGYLFGLNIIFVCLKWFSFTHSGISQRT
jgi:hypothetical protein